MQNDVQFGKAIYNAALGRFTFQGGGDVFDAVKVTARRSGDNAVMMTFAQTLGSSSANIAASAVATLVPRDIVVVIDLSNSMCYDSQLRYYNRSDGGYSNLRDIWAALDGAEPSRPYIPGSELETEYASDTGPTFGKMTEWGDPLLPGYNPTNDEGLYYIRPGYTTTEGELVSALATRGYNAAEINALVNGPYDSQSTSFRNRTAVLLGLAEWHSGKEDGKFGRPAATATTGSATANSATGSRCPRTPTAAFSGLAI